MTTLIPKYDQGSTGAVNRPINQKFAETISVKDFGAVGNGTTDDSYAIQAALNAVGNGGRLYVPAGKYLINTPLTVSNKTVFIQGDGIESILYGDNTILTLTSCDYSQISNIKLLNKTAMWTFQIQNGDGTFKTASQATATLNQSNGDNQYTYSVNFDGQVPGLTTALTAAQPTSTTVINNQLAVISSNYVTLDNITTWYYQLYFKFCNNCTVQNCNVYGATNWGNIFFENGGTAGVDTAWGLYNAAFNNIIRYGAYSGIILMRQKYFTAEGNRIFASGESGIKTYQNNIGNSRRCYECHFVDNYCDQTVYDGLDIHADDGTPVQRVDDYTLTQYAWHNLPTNHVIADNHVLYGDIYIDGQSITVTGNTVTNSRTSGIQSTGGFGTISDNIIINYNTTLPATGNHGISTAGYVVTGNQIFAGNPTSGYPIFNTNGVTANNIVSGNGTYIFNGSNGASGGVNIQNYGGTWTPSFNVITNKFTADFGVGLSYSNTFNVNTPTKNSGDGFGWSGPDSYGYYSRSGSSGAMTTFWNSAGLAGSISTSGLSTTYGTTSDYRLKSNPTPMTNALDKIGQLNPVTFTWDKDGTPGQGFIAHELQAVFPDAVTGEKDANRDIGNIVDKEGNIIQSAVPKPSVDEDGYTWTKTGSEPVYQSVDSSFVIATLVAAIKELKSEIDTLKAGK